jgi:hypothetical protein
MNKQKTENRRQRTEFTSLACMIFFCVLYLLIHPPLLLSEETPVGTQAIKVGNEIVVMADGPGETMRSFPAVAFGKDIFLVAWQEGWQGKGGSSRIFVARVGLDGKLLDSKGIEIAPCKTGVQENPRVAFFNNTFLVAWQDMRNKKDCDILGARISPDGKVLDKQPIAIAASPRTQAIPDIAADNKGFMVVWHGFEGKEIYPKIFTARVSPNGSPGKPIAIVNDSAAPRIAWNGKEHLVIHTTRQSKTWLRMDTAGKVLPAPKVRSWLKGLTWDPRFSACGLADGSGWLMVFHGGDPNWWYRSMGIQRVAKIPPEGVKEAPGDNSGNYSPKGGVIPVNWLDTS